MHANATEASGHNRQKLLSDDKLAAAYFGS